jgi:hypothetical protein
VGTLNKPPILLDAYYTPDALASFLVNLLPIHGNDLVLEPSAGGGAFVKALLHKTNQVVAIDLNPDAPGLKMVGSAVCDFLDVLPPNPPDWIIGNPPYFNASEHVEHALNCTDRHVGFLLRLAFLESKRRAAFWKKNPCRKVFVLSERPSFTGGRTDNSAYGFFWWDILHNGPTELEVISWK